MIERQAKKNTRMETKMKLYFTRHGETDWNLLKKIQGKQDTELNATGIMQAEQLGDNLLLGKYNFTKIYSSTQKRARRTAEIVAEKLNMDFETLEGLEEMNLGLWEGLSWNEVEERFPKEFENWFINRRYMKTPEGESYQDLLDRVLSAIKNIIETQEGNVLVVTHSAVIMALLCYLHNTPFEEMVGKYDIKNAELVEIDSKDLF